VKFRNLAFADREQNHVMVRELLEEPRHVFLIAGQAVKAFRHDDVEPSLPGVLQQRLIPGSQV
jgi:hypothetical protein